MKVLYLFSGSRVGALEKIKNGENHGNGFWGMIQLPKYGVEAEYIELEQYFSQSWSKFFRKYLGVYNMHLLLFWKFFSYDIIYTSTAFGSQLLHSILHLKKPLWVMHDFSIVSLLGDEKTLKQKIFRYLVKRCAGIVTLSIDEKNVLESKFENLRGKIECIPFGIDMQFFVPGRVKQESQVLSVGMDPDRDWKALISAARDIDVNFVITTKESRVKKYFPLPNNIKVCQFSARDLVREYDKSKLVVIPLNTSLGVNDAMGCSVLFEALSMGKAIIATKTKAMESYITHGENGWLVAEGNVEEMKKAIKLILEDDVLREKLAKNARSYALKNLDIERCTERLAHFFKRISDNDKLN